MKPKTIRTKSLYVLSLFFFYSCLYERKLFDHKSNPKLSYSNTNELDQELYKFEANDSLVFGGYWEKVEDTIFFTRINIKSCVQKVPFYIKDVKNWAYKASGCNDLNHFSIGSNIQVRCKLLHKELYEIYFWVQLDDESTFSSRKVIFSEKAGIIDINLTEDKNVYDYGW